MPVDATRRAFLSGSLLTRAGRARAVQMLRPLGPPPPGLSSVLASQACDGCDGRCVEACPQGVLRLHPGIHALAGRPYLSFENGACTFCGTCVETCPAVPTPAVPPKSAGQAEVDVDKCLAWSGVVCMTCYSHCHRKALRPDRRRRPTVANHACTGCGACISVCPTAAITVAFPLTES